ncbi:MAG: hypothetical protein IKT93_00700 [Clostridia bacterium]|nr:hypothetical protein [Clostridia bacterium]
MKKLIAFICSICIISAFFSTITASAAIVEKGHIIIGSTPAVTGDTVTIPISIENNPGIMAITISITYDSKALKYIEHIPGKVVKDFDNVIAHPNRNLIRFVCLEPGDRTRDDVIMSLVFEVKDNAEFGFSKIDIEYSPGDFCNWNLDRIMPTITSGGVDIAFNGNNCSHKIYNEWKTIAEPTCISEGIMERICQKCNHVDSKKIKKIGHEFPEEWTVEKEATSDIPGTMVRYCLTCNEFVDRIEYTIEDSEKGEFENQVGNEIPKNEVIEELFKEQYPDKEISPINPPLDSSSSSQNQSTDSSQEQSGANDILNAIISDDTINEEKIATVAEKIAEVFPNFELIIKAFKTAFIILAIIIIL